MKYLIVSDGTKCVGCGICELVCSAVKEKCYSPSKSRIKATRLGPIMTAITCRLCEEAPCVAACPEKALAQSEETGIVEVDQQKCTRCSWCLTACKFGAINIVEGKLLICDLCQGDPQCVKICPVQALQFTTLDQAVEEMKLCVSKGVQEITQSGIIIGCSEDFKERWSDVVKIVTEKWLRNHSAHDTF